MRRIDSLYDQMNDIVRFDLGNGKEIAVSGHTFRLYGFEAVADYARECGAILPTERQPVFWNGKQVGTLPPVCDPSSTRSVFYEARPHDWTALSHGKGWEAHRSLGRGDLSSVPGFVWDDDPTRADRDREEDRRIALAALTAK